jgi:sarcosine oxidase subunit alpha
MAERWEPVEDPVIIEHDGTAIPARSGEPIAHALIAQDRLLLARSPKLHRPRGPYCLRGACDGCLARVDGVPNVMTCQVRLRGGERIETQNVVGSRETDLLRATDFLFPQGFDHHKLLAGVPVVSGLLSRLARRISGLGELPDQAFAKASSQRLEAGVLVVGGGRAGMLAATELARRSQVEVHLVEEAPELGGTLALREPEAATKLEAALRATSVEVHTGSRAIGLFEHSRAAFAVVLAGAKGIVLAEPRAIVLATGRNDPAALFGNNDLPGVFTARAALQLWRAGVSPGRRILLVDAGELGHVLLSSARGAFTVTHVDSSNLLAATGLERVTGARLHGHPRRFVGDAIVVDGRASPAHELACQAGAELYFEEGAYRLAPTGRVARGVWVTGSLLSPHSEDPGGLLAEVLDELAPAPH